MMPNAKGRRRRFGAVRRLPSGRYQARYPGPDGVVRPADDTFETKSQAEVWLARKEAEILEGDWIAPDAGRDLALRVRRYLDRGTPRAPAQDDHAL
jgi:hypothetical protein